MASEPMRIRVITLGQDVRITKGKYKGHCGWVKKHYFFADSRNMGYYYHVRVSGRRGVQTCPEDWVEAVR